MAENKKFKCTDEEFESFVEIFENLGNLNEAIKEFSIEYNFEVTDESSKYLIKRLKKMGYLGYVPLENTNEFMAAKQREFDNTKEVFFVTYAQSGTPIHKEAFKNILSYAKYKSAGIHVVAGRYKNPTSLNKSRSIEAEEEKEKPWDEMVLPYLDANRQNVHKYLTICSDIKVQPTASIPISRLGGVTKEESCIIAHPRVQMESLPVLEGYRNKFMFSTGAITLADYTDTKAGKLGAFHHQIGFLIIEIDGDDFHVRQIQCDEDGGFYDLNCKVHNGKVKENYREKSLGIIFGDLHIGEHNQKVVDKSFEMADMVNADNVIIHDIFNGHSISHHEAKDPFILLNRELDKSISLKKEIKQMLTFMGKYEKYNFVVVRSNHDDFLDRWLVNVDWRKVPNKYEYLKYANILAQGKAKNGIIPYVLEKKFKNIKALGINDSYKLGSYECGMHGHLGANGSRGGHNQFKNMNTKNVTAHTHSPRRIDGHLCVGTLTFKRVAYNKGASSWAHANVVIYPNGKASHIFITDSNKFYKKFVDQK